jgi:hypothetical protein
MSVTTADWPARDRWSTEGYVYVLEFSTGVVKVGRTRNPQQRAAKVAAEAGSFGVRLTRWWLSRPHLLFEDSERHLLTVGCRIGKRVGPETFRCDFHEMVAEAQTVGAGRYMPAPRFESQAVLRAKERRERVRELRDEGYSYRKIAAELGISLGTITADCRALGI